MGRKRSFRLCSFPGSNAPSGWLVAACKVSLKAALRFSKAQLFLCSSLPKVPSSFGHFALEISTLRPFLLFSYTFVSHTGL